MLPVPKAAPAPNSARGNIPRSPAGNFLSSSPSSSPGLRQGHSPAQGYGQEQEQELAQGLSSSVSSNSNRNIGIGRGRDYSNDQFGKSPSGLSYLSSSSTSTPAHPGLGRRRSTDTSGGLDYYFSSLAGAGAGPSSSSSSLGISVSPSPSSGLALNIPHSDSGSYSQHSDSNPNLNLNLHPDPSPSSSSRSSPNPSLTKGNPGQRSNSSLTNIHEADLDMDMEVSDQPSSNQGHSHSARNTPHQLDINNQHFTRPLNISYPSKSSNSMTPNINTSNNSGNNENDNSLRMGKGTGNDKSNYSRSPGGWSESSRYSNNESAPPSAHSPANPNPNPNGNFNADPRPAYNGNGSTSSNHLARPPLNHSDSESSGSAYSPADYKLQLQHQVGSFDFEEPGEGGGLFDGTLPSQKDQKHNPSHVHGRDGAIDEGRWDVRSSVNSASTYRQQHHPQQSQNQSQAHASGSQDDTHRTPMAPNNGQRPEIRPPQLSLNLSPNSSSSPNQDSDFLQQGAHMQRQDYYRSSPNSSSTHSAGHSTPKRSPNPGTAGSRDGHYTPVMSGRTGSGFGAISPARSSSSHSHGNSHGHGHENERAAYHSESAPRSAPAAKSEFTELGFKQDRDGDGHGINQDSGDDDTLGRKNKGKSDDSRNEEKRRTLPATTSTSSGRIIESLLGGDSRENLLSPDKYARAVTPTRDHEGGAGERRGSNPSPNRSPDPPPKSRLRQRNNPASEAAGIAPISQANSSSSPTMPQSLPMIINTLSSPLPSPEKSKAEHRSNDTSTSQPRRPDRSPDRQHTPVFPSSATINDLTDMLGGAIDAIGLIDSRDTPPPTVGEPHKREKPKMSLTLAPAAEVTDRGPMTPTSLPTRGASLAGPSVSSTSLATNATVPGPQVSTIYGQTQGSSQPYSQPQSQSQQPQSYGQPQAHTRRSTQPELQLHHKASSIYSVGGSTTSNGGHPYVQSPTTTMTTMTISVRPWPAAMLFGNIKVMKHAGDRAKGYARAINELARSESGLKEWCIAASAQSHRPNPPSKMSAVSSLGVRSTTIPSAIPISMPYQLTLSPYDPSPAPHPRNVSAGSEFPMRADSYTAREISQRVLDPADPPTSLPSNLPYPQLQLQAQAQTQGGYLSSINGGNVGGGLKPSQSMQSVASFSSTSTKKGFFSAIGRKGTSKKESLSLGPPGAGGVGGSGNGSIAKKDVRGLPISGPRSSSPQKVDSAISPGFGLQAHRVQNSISAPSGPRGPRIGSFTPPPPSSGSRERSSIDLQPGRASLDTGLSRMGPRGSLDGHSFRAPAKGISATSIPISAPMPHRGSSLTTASTPVSATSSSGPSPGPGHAPGVRDEEVRQMADILPHVEKSTLRNYLIRYGDQMQAIGTYLEDEKTGTVLR